MPKLIGGQRKETAMAKHEYRNNQSTKSGESTEQGILQPIPEPIFVEGGSNEPSGKTAPKKGASKESSATKPSPRTATKRKDIPPSRFEQLRAKGRSWVDGVVDALDDAFARLDAHEERLDDFGRRFNAHEDRFGDLTGRIEALEERPTPVAPEPVKPASVTVTIKVEGGDVKIE